VVLGLRSLEVLVTAVIIIDRYLRDREQSGEPIRFGMFGAGFMGRGVFNQQRHTVGWRCSAVCNRSVDTAVQALCAAGAPDITVVSTTAELDRVIQRGGTAVTAEPEVICASNLLECMVEATGHVEYGAQVTTLSISHGKHVVLMNAELDGTVGPQLQILAEKAGVILSGCDGDQPGVQLNLYRFVQSLGLEPLVCGNIKGLQDRYRTPATQESFARQWGQSPAMVTSFADGTKISFEQAIVANATGMQVSRRGMIGFEHTGHVDELVHRFGLEELRQMGGIVDYAIGSQPSPGVFVFAAAHDETQAQYLDYGKLGSGPLYSFYVPYHLTIFEVPLTVARVVGFGDAAIRPDHGPRVDVVATAKRPLCPGEVIDGLGHYMTYGLCENHAIVREQRLLPMGLAEGSIVQRRIEADEVLGLDDVEPPGRSLAHQLRSQQDHTFNPEGELA
jgi:predicted homoserine dehydrogenase-like protein